MANISSITSAAVLQAMRDFDVLGRRAFLRKYGYGTADKYFVLYRNKYYDSKAIVGVGYGIQNPTHGALRHDELYGGLLSAVRVLRKLGFSVTESAPRFLVLAENEVIVDPKHSWQDVTGERYHFPNGYRNKIKPGSKFIYYKGKRRRGGVVGTPEYFGWGVIGAVSIDSETIDQPANRRKWIAEIAEYSPFDMSVPFKAQNGVVLETGTTSVSANYWSTGCREIDQERFEHIVKVSGGDHPDPIARPIILWPTNITPIEVANHLLVPRRFPAIAGVGNSGGGHRYSGQAKVVGDRAEEIVLEWLREKIECESDRAHVIWVSAQGETPGYDIEDRRASDRPIGYEVKATMGPEFPSVYLTSNELAAAKRLGDRYYLVLVSMCGNASPRIEAICNPAAQLDSGMLQLTPTVYRLERTPLSWETTQTATGSSAHDRPQPT